MRLYTEPPRGLYHPYLMVNPRTHRLLFKREFEHAILDAGVHIFHGATDYRPSFLTWYEWRAQMYSEIFKGRLWVVIPDYPDDYKHIPGNVDKTLENTKRFIKVPGIEWVPVLQARYHDVFSFHESCQRVKQLIGSYPRVAIGTVCKTQNVRFIEACCRAARAHFPASWIHAFGITLRAVPRVKDLLDSCDSMSFTIYQTEGSIRQKATRQAHKRELFKKWVARFDELSAATLS